VCTALRSTFYPISFVLQADLQFVRVSAMRNCPVITDNYIKPTQLCNTQTNKQNDEQKRSAARLNRGNSTFRRIQCFCMVCQVYRGICLRPLLQWNIDTGPFTGWCPEHLPDIQQSKVAVTMYSGGTWFESCRVLHSNKQAAILKIIVFLGVTPYNCWEERAVSVFKLNLPWRLRQHVSPKRS
jgi:hypothetical protein